MMKRDRVSPKGWNFTNSLAHFPRQKPAKRPTTNTPDRRWNQQIMEGVPLSACCIVRGWGSSISTRCIVSLKMTDLNSEFLVKEGANIYSLPLANYKEGAFTDTFHAFPPNMH